MIVKGFIFAMVFIVCSEIKAACALTTQSESKRIVNEAEEVESKIDEHLSSVSANLLNDSSSNIDSIYGILNQKYSEKGEGSAPSRIHYLSLP